MEARWAGIAPAAGEAGFGSASGSGAAGSEPVGSAIAGAGRSASGAASAGAAATASSDGGAPNVSSDSKRAATGSSGESASASAASSSKKSGAEPRGEEARAPDAALGGVRRGGVRRGRRLVLGRPHLRRRRGGDRVGRGRARRLVAARAGDPGRRRELVEQGRQAGDGDGHGGRLGQEKRDLVADDEQRDAVGDVRRRPRPPRPGRPARTRRRPTTPPRRARRASSRSTSAVGASWPGPGRPGGRRRGPRRPDCESATKRIRRGGFHGEGGIGGRPANGMPDPEGVRQTGSRSLGRARFVTCPPRIRPDVRFRLTTVPFALALLSLEGAGRVTAHRLLERFPTAEAVREAPREQVLLRLKGVAHADRTVDAICDAAFDDALDRRANGSTRSPSARSTSSRPAPPPGPPASTRSTAPTGPSCSTPSAT